MKIEYCGHSCFVLASKDGKKIMTDPYTRVGYELPANLAVDTITISHRHFDHNYTKAVACNKMIDGAGNQTSDIYGIECYHDPEQGRLRGKNIIYKINIDGIVVCHLGDLGEEYSSTLLDKIGNVDVLLIPVGGRYTIDAVQAKEYVDKINPKTVIPMHYKPSDGILDIDGIDRFLSLFDSADIETVESGETEFCLDKPRKRVIYMERVRK